MELPIYETLEDFKNKYPFDFENQHRYNFEEYLTLLRGAYYRIVNEWDNKNLKWIGENAITFKGFIDNAGLLKNSQRKLIVLEIDRELIKYTAYPKTETNANNNSVITVFSGNKDVFNLFKFLAENFIGAGAKFTDKTKFNQIYFYINTEQQIPKGPYKKMVFDLYNFEYGNSEIKGITEKHQLTLKNLEFIFRDLDRNKKVIN